MKTIKIGGAVVRIDRLSAVLESDSKVRHLGQSSTVTYFFAVIVDGQKIDLEGSSAADRDEMKEKLLETWNNYNEESE